MGHSPTESDLPGEHRNNDLGGKLFNTFYHLLDMDENKLEKKFEELYIYIYT